MTRGFDARSGSLTIVGIGPDADSIGHAAFELLVDRARAARRHRKICFYSLDVDPARVGRLLRGVPVREFYPFYRTSVPRSVFYERVARILVDRAFTSGREVVVLASGNPLIMAKPVSHMRIMASELGRSLTIVPGMSFLDTVLAPVNGLNDPRGLAIQIAFYVCNGQVDVNPNIPTLLVQLVAWSSSGLGAVTAPDTPERERFLVRLVRRLRGHYPAAHEVHVLDADLSRGNYGKTVAQPIKLRDLPRLRMSSWANLFLPALGRPLEHSSWPPRRGLGRERIGAQRP